MWCRRGGGTECGALESNGEIFCEKETQTFFRLWV